MQPVVTALAVGADGREGIRRVQPVIAEELERVAVEGIGAGLGHGVHRRGRMVAVLRRQRIRFDLELLHRVRERQRQAQAVHRLVVRAAVERVGHPRRQAAGDDDGGVRIAAYAGVHDVAARRIGRALAAGRQTCLEHELLELTAVQRQLEHLLVRDHLADAGIPRLDERRGALHRDRLGELSELQRDVERRIRIHLQDDAGLNEFAEALQLRIEAVGANRQVLQDVGTRLVAHCGAHEAGFGLRDRDGDARKDRAALIADGAVDLCRGDRLRPGGRRREKNEQQSVNGDPDEPVAHMSLPPSPPVRLRRG